MLIFVDILFDICDKISNTPILFVFVTMVKGALDAWCHRQGGCKKNTVS